ncbi:hypothetical protein [Methanospirillum hungatei]|nr:hypothetical protein [Methanospirillum hungatei]HOW04220.1 hypothetical protein [Methanospirillum hungatei]
MDTISNIRIGPRLLIGFIIVILLMGLVGVIGFYRDEFYQHRDG